MPGNNTLPLIISATMQPTDHTSTGGGGLDDRVGWRGGGGHANKMVRKTIEQKRDKNANRVAAMC